MADLFGTTKAPAIVTSSTKSMIISLDEVEETMECIRASDKMKADFIPMWDEAIENFFVTPIGGGRSGRPGVGWPSPFYPNRSRTGASVLKDPETHQMVMSLLGQLLTILGLRGSGEFVQAIPLGADDPEKARLISKLIMSLLTQPGTVQTYQQIIQNALIFGTSYLELGWETRTRQQVVKLPNIDPGTGEQFGWRLETQEVMYRDRPLQREPDIYDIFVDPSGTNIQEDMLWVIKRFRLTKDQARALTVPAIPGEPALFSREAVERAISRSKIASFPNGGVSTSLLGDISANPQRKFDDLATDPPDRFGQITGFEKWGISVVNRQGSNDTAKNRRIVVWGGENVASTINPFLDGNIPIKEFRVNPVSGRHYGLAPTEVTRFLQDSNDSLLMAFVDAVNAAVAGPLLVGQTFLGNLEQLKRRKLLDLIECRDVTAVAPVPVDYNAITLAASAMAQGRLRMREASGTNLINPTKEVVGDRASATQTSEVVRVASQFGELLAQPIESDAFPWVGRILHSRVRQNMPDDGAVFSLAGESFTIRLEDIDRDADIRFVGSRSSQSKFQRVASLDKFMLTLQQNQDVVLGAPEIAIRMAQELEIADAEKVVLKYRQFLIGILNAQQEQGEETEAASSASPGGGNAEATAAQFNGGPI